MDIQALMDAFGAAAKTTRRGYHLTLGKLISALEAAPSDAVVELDCGGSPSKPHSYRGYYEDLAFEAAPSPITAEQFLSLCRSVHNQVLGGWKGGDYLMDDDAVLWIANKGSSGGRAVLGAHVVGGKLLLLTKAMDD